MADVIPLRRPEPLFWKCGCGCMSFYLRDDGAALCAACDKEAESGWWRPVVQLSPDKFEPQATSVVVGLGRRRTVDFANAGAEFVLAASRDGAFLAWADDTVNTEWIRALLGEAIAMYPDERRDDDEVQSEPDEGQG